MLDRINRPGHCADGIREPAEENVENVNCRTFLVEVEVKIRHRQPAGQIFEQKRQIRCDIQADGGWKLVGGSFFPEFVIELGYFFSKRLFENDFVDIQTSAGIFLNGIFNFMPKTVQEARTLIDGQGRIISPYMSHQSI